MWKTLQAQKALESLHAELVVWKVALSREDNVLVKLDSKDDWATIVSCQGGPEYHLILYPPYK